MTDVERFQAARIHLAQVYATTATKLLDAVIDNPAGNLWGQYGACRTAWNALVDVENALRASVFAEADEPEFATGGLVCGPGPDNLPLFDFDRCEFGRYLPNATLPSGMTITVDFDAEAPDWTALLADLNERFKLRRQEERRA